LCELFVSGNRVKLKGAGGAGVPSSPEMLRPA
jgi:hypothetical protein